MRGGGGRGRGGYGKYYGKFDKPGGRMNNNFGFSGGDEEDRRLKVTCILVGVQEFAVCSKYDQQLVDFLKSMPKREYDSAKRRWCFPMSDYATITKRLQSLDYINLEQIPVFVLQSRILILQKQAELEMPVDLSILGEGLLEKLMPFQREGITLAIRRGGRVLLADEMGLGKTLQAIGIASYFISEWPLLIVTPSSLRFTWKNQILSWLPSFPEHEITVILHGKDLLIKTKVVIISYDLMCRKKEELFSLEFNFVIFDESHSLKSATTNRTKVATRIIKSSKHFLLLSGTPALSRPVELHSQLSYLYPSYFPNLLVYAKRYCDAKATPYGWDYKGSSNLDELNLILENLVMIRREKKNVLDQLPEKLRKIIHLDPTKCNTSRDKQLQKFQSDIAVQMRQRKTLDRSTWMQFFVESATAKVDAVTNYLSNVILEQNSKCLIFAHHQTMLNGIQSFLEGAKVSFVRIDGRTQALQRTQACDKFTDDETCRVALLSITAAGTGLTLVAAKLVIFAELFWNPGILQQAEDRAHRIGQKSDVTIEYLLATGTSDDVIWPMINSKLNVLSSIGLTSDTFRGIRQENQEADLELLLADLYPEKTSQEQETSSTAKLVNTTIHTHGKYSSCHSLSKITQPQQNTLDKYLKPQSAVQPPAASEVLIEKENAIEVENSLDSPLLKKNKVDDDEEDAKETCSLTEEDLEALFSDLD